MAAIHPLGLILPTLQGSFEQFDQFIYRLHLLGTSRSTSLELRHRQMQERWQKRSAPARPLDRGRPMADSRSTSFIPLF